MSQKNNGYMYAKNHLKSAKFLIPAYVHAYLSEQLSAHKGNKVHT